MIRTLFLASLLVTSVGCATTIRPGEVGVRQAFGKLAENHRTEGVVIHPPLAVHYVRVPIRTQNVEFVLDLPSKEGLNVQSTVSVLYAVEPDLAPTLIQTVGPRYEQDLVNPVFRSAAADVSARYAAKDLHSGQRRAIEQEIALRMNEVLAGRGLAVQAVLMKSIKLPPGLYASIEARLSAEQDAERMQFIIEQEKRNAERRRIEAEGIRDAQRVLEEGLSPQILQWRSIEAFQQLAESPGTRVIVTDGSLPFLVDDAPAPVAE